MTYAIDPELAPIIDLLPVREFDDVVASRAFIEELVRGFEADTTGLDIADRSIPGPEGAPDVRVRTYRRTGLAGPAPAILYIHGGGFTVGSIETEHAGAAGLASELPVLVVSVDYRLAPEHPYPAGLEDCFAALKWLHDAADELGLDPERVAVQGSSAGGGLAAGLALLARDRGAPALCFQYLGIPELDDRLSTPSMVAFVDTPMWNRPAAEASWRHYLGGRSADDVPIYAAPARATDLSGLPPAYVSTMEFDPLRDEGIAYASALLQAGVSVELHSFPGTFHGSAVVATAAVSRRAALESVVVMARALGVERMPLSATD